MNDLISIIIPIYNVENYIGECLTSVINQTYKNLEIICIDDCGSDNSVNITESFMKKDSRIKLIKHSENMGLPQARNTGIKNSNGKYLFFLDSDDYIKSDIIEKMYNNALDTNADIVISNFEAFCENIDGKKLIEKVNKSRFVKKNLKILKTDIFNFEKVFITTPCLSWGKLFKTSFIKDNTIRYINQKVMYEDNGFYLKLLSKFPLISYIPEQGVYYRVRENSITSKYDEKRFKKIKTEQLKGVIDDAFKYIKTETTPDIYKKIFYIVKNSDAYKEYFSRWYDVFWNFRWNNYNKLIKVFAIPIFRQKNNKKELITKIFGLTVNKQDLSK